MHSPAAFAKFVRAVYKEFAGGFGRFFDEDTYEKSRKEIYASSSSSRAASAPTRRRSLPTSS